jgi:hypothetical protein
VTTAITAQISSSEAVIADLQLRADCLNPHGFAPRLDIGVKRGRHDNDAIPALLVPLNPIERFAPN